MIKIHSVIKQTLILFVKETSCHRDFVNFPSTYLNLNNHQTFSILKTILKKAMCASTHFASKRKKENHQFQKLISQITHSYPNKTISYQF